jgi:thiamine biosynthesis lipoprotein
MPKFLTIFFFFYLSSCDYNPQIDEIHGATMGTTYTIKGENIGIYRAKIEQYLTQFNQIFSSWDAQSEISQFNLSAINQRVKLSQKLAFVLRKSADLHQQTNGYFDVGMGRLIDVWGFGDVKIDKKPSAKIIQQALVNSSIKRLNLTDLTATKNADIRLNLSALAKGYAVDEIAELLKNENIGRFMVEIGGEIKTRGDWKIGIESPDNQAPIAIDLIDEAIATSGNYRNYFVWQNQQYAHILNPHTGAPVDSDLFSASVIHPSAMSADAYATAMMAMGSEKARQFARRQNLKTVLILKSGENVIKLGL